MIAQGDQQDNHSASAYYRGFEAGKKAERERIVDLLKTWCNATLQHEDFMKELMEGK